MYHLPLSAVANAIKTRRVLATRKPTLSGLKVCNAPRVYTAAYSRRLRCLSVYLALADWVVGRRLVTITRAQRHVHLIAIFVKWK